MKSVLWICQYYYCKVSSCNPTSTCTIFSQFLEIVFFLHHNKSPVLSVHTSTCKSSCFKILCSNFGWDVLCTEFSYFQLSCYTFKCIHVISMVLLIYSKLLNALTKLLRSIGHDLLCVFTALIGSGFNWSGSVRIQNIVVYSVECQNWLTYTIKVPYEAHYNNPIGLRLRFADIKKKKSL